VRFKTILHATDFSAASRPAFERALRLAKAAKARLIVVHAFIPPVPPVSDGYIDPNTWRVLEASARRDAERDLARLIARARAAGVPVTARLLVGAPHVQIPRAARALRADLVVLGTHGRTGLPRLLLGSVAERVVALAPCPVLTVRGRPAARRRRAARAAPRR
jgi:nucleotide-binding universal stress UspA family protein